MPRFYGSISIVSAFLLFSNCILVVFIIKPFAKKKTAVLISCNDVLLQSGGFYDV